MPARISLALALAFLIALSAYARPAQADPTAELSPPTLTPGLPQPQPAPVLKEQATLAAAEACDYETIYAVESANLEWVDATPSLRAYGTVRTGGWSNGTLLPVAGGDDGATLTFRFVACPPRGYSTQALAPIEARAALTAGIKQLRYIVIVAETGSQTLDMSRYH